MLLLLGSGGNGKSVALRVLEGMLGQMNVSHIRPDKVGKPVNLERLGHVLVNSVHEWGSIGIEEERHLKQVISGSPMDTRGRWSGTSIVPRGKLAVASNWLPEFSDTSDGLWRRLLIIPFVEQFDDAPDTNLAADMVQNELKGIVAWAVAGLTALLIRGRFPNCPSCRIAKDEHREATDSVKSFIEDCIERGKPDAQIPKDICYEMYCEYVSKGRRGTTSPVPYSQFRQAMENNGFPVVRGPVHPNTQRRKRAFSRMDLSPLGRSLAKECRMLWVDAGELGELMRAEKSGPSPGPWPENN
jgi:putative DNA primase/helicase